MFARLRKNGGWLDWENVTNWCNWSGTIHARYMEWSSKTDAGKEIGMTKIKNQILEKLVILGAINK